ncbi:hypothetical protein OS493_025421 [Desmophyllum pertusum]|uniref:Uncharacterized protein n=1 Tax=Desmophyllum pertusum TaxID=174260 RepID=A0A9W9YPH3_9CNID|nr:hypothetical protein OS493_025421 [Desmophyllum pertusum]
MGRKRRRSPGTHDPHHRESEGPLAGTAPPVNRRASLPAESARPQPHQVGQVGSGHGITRSRPVPCEGGRFLEDLRCATAVSSVRTPKPPHPSHFDSRQQQTRLTAAPDSGIRLPPTAAAPDCLQEEEPQETKAPSDSPRHTVGAPPIQLPSAGSGTVEDPPSTPPQSPQIIPHHPPCPQRVRRPPKR